MRTNKRKPVDSAALTSAWAKVFAEAKIESIEVYESKGWMTAETFSNHAKLTIHAARHQLDRMQKNGKLESKKIRAMVSGSARTVNIYRPQT
jgi:predicted ArsR family transcriptional regulator